MVPNPESAQVGPGFFFKRKLRLSLKKIFQQRKRLLFFSAYKPDFPGRKPANGLTPYRSVVIMECEIPGNTEDGCIDKAGLYQIPQNAPAVEGRT